MSIENQKWLPLPWLRIENSISPPLTVQSQQIQQIKLTEQTKQTKSVWNASASLPIHGKCGLFSGSRAAIPCAVEPEAATLSGR